MSTIKTLSSFYWGTNIDEFNFAIDFDEGGFEKNASLVIGDYTLTEFAIQIQSALRLTGTLLYTVYFDRTTRKLTISAPSNFTLRCNTGSRLATSAWALMGFSTTSNKTGLSMNPFYENINGVQNALDFYEYLTNKNKVEFIPDTSNKMIFYKLFLESSAASRQGTDLELQNMKAPDWYETGLLTFREVI